MNNHQRFMRPVKALAPDDQLIFQAAQQVTEEKWPGCPGIAALEFLVRLAMLLDQQPRPSKPTSKKPQQHEDPNQACVVIKTSADDLVGKPLPIRYPLALPNALRVMSAEHWLNRGQPDEALRELERLSSKAMKHPWALRVQQAAVSALRELNGQVHAE